MLNGKKTVFTMLTMFLIVTASSIGCAVNILQSAAEKSQDALSDSQFLDYNITIPDDYSTIQEGIDNAKSGDVIFVRSGVYRENIIVNKPGLYLLGENNKNTIIDADKNEKDAVVINASNVIIEEFNIIKARCKEKVIWDQSGIEIYSSNVTVRNNIISNNRLGINAYATAYNLTIVNNQFFYDGIFVGNYLNCNKLPKKSVIHNIQNNTANGKHLYYYKNIKEDFVVPNDAGQIILANCTNITIKDTYLTNTDFPIILYYCSNCVVENCITADTDGELILFCSENNTIQNNTTPRNMHGICLDYGSVNNTVRYNNVSENYVGISIITCAVNNIVYGNKIHDNMWGVKITTYSEGLPSYNNIVYENEFYNNEIGVRISPTFDDVIPSTYNNTVKNNTFTKNRIGIQLRLTAENTIENNYFKNNIISSTFYGATDTTWNHNYWNRFRILPKVIFGVKRIGKIPIPWVNFDQNPARQPTV